jgi:hypothetical protein
LVEPGQRWVDLPRAVRPRRLPANLQALLQGVRAILGFHWLRLALLVQIHNPSARLDREPVLTEGSVAPLVDVPRVVSFRPYRARIIRLWPGSAGR